MNPNQLPPNHRPSWTRVLFDGVEFVFDLGFEIIAALLDALGAF
jgi:hypothetical protein